MDEPTRWLDDPSIDPDLRGDLSAATEAGLPSLDLDGGLARLEDAMSRSGGGGDQGPGPSGPGGAAPWIAGAVAGLLFAGLGAWWALSSDDRAVAGSGPVVEAPEEPARDEGVAEPVPDEPEVSAEPPAEATANAAEADVATPPGEAASPRPRARPPASRSTSAVSDLLRDEMEITARSRRSLARRPARALALALEGNRRFADGLFVEERDAIAVLALAALDRNEEARGRGARFLRSHPRGPFSERVRRAIEDTR